jgi:hypothetical protein
MAADIPGAHQKTIGDYENYDTKGFVVEMRRMSVTPHVAITPLALVVPPSIAALPATRATPNRSMPAAASKRCVSCAQLRLRLDQTMGRSASDQAARHRQGECGVWPARDRLEHDTPGQPAKAGYGGGMNRQLPRDLPRRQRSGSPNGVKHLKSGLLGC